MINIRFGVFETNSSSVHTMTIASQEDYDKWLKDEIFLVNEDEQYYLEKNTDYNPNDIFVSKDTAKRLYKQLCKQEEYYLPAFDEIFFTFDKWDDNREYLYTYEEEYTTKNGEKLVIFGYHGYDG